MNLEQIRWWRAQEARTDFEIALCDAALKGLQAEVVQFSPTGDNHHNAWKCPYCRPEMEKERPAIIEECARVCDELYSDTAWHPYYRQAANNCAETIRAKMHQWRDIKVVGKDAIRALAPGGQNTASQAASDDELSHHLDGEHHALRAQSIDSPMNACSLKETCLWLKKLALSAPAAPAEVAEGAGEPQA